MCQETMQCSAHQMRLKIVEEAKTWIGTPFHIQQCKKGIGVDCVNLILEIGVNLGICESLPRNMLNYTRCPNPNHLINGMRYFLKEGEPFELGNLFCISWRKNLPQHTGIYIGNYKAIHASQKYGVMETKITDFNFNIHSWWSYKNV